MNDDPTPPRRVWARLGGQLGVGLCAVGFLLVFLGWNGAASSDRLPSQFPYLISGGVAGLCFVVLGVGMIVVQNQRTDRAALQASLRELQDALVQAGLAQPSADARPPFAKPGPRPRPDDGQRPTNGAGVERAATRTAPLVADPAAASDPADDAAPRTERTGRAPGKPTPSGSTRSRKTAALPAE